MVMESLAGCACSPLKPARCKAMRLGRHLRVDDPGSVAACPRMVQEQPAPYGCVPLAIAGRSAAVLRMVREDRPIAIGEVLDAAAIAQRFAVRVGVQRLLNTTTRQARTDPLTGLPNRRVGLDNLDRMLARARDGGTEAVAVMVLDLDHFKKLNDTYGHAAGDQALRAIVDAVRVSLPPEAFMARIGGEEFLLATPVAGRAAAMELAEATCEVVRRLKGEGGIPATTLSVGVALFPADGDAPAPLMAVADERLYLAKNHGRDRAVGPAEASSLPRLAGLHEVDAPEPVAFGR